MNRKQKIRIGDLLVQHKVISESQLGQALAEQKTSGRKLGRVLVDLGYTTENQILDLLSTQLDIPHIDLRHFRLDTEMARKLPETHARRYRGLPLSANDDGSVLVAMADPTDIFAFDEISRLLGKTVHVGIVREADLMRTIDLVYRRTEEISSLAEELGEELSDGDYDLDELMAEDELTDAPVIRLLQSMFEDAVQVSASDIHIEPDEQVLRIRQRVDGVLQEQIIEGKRIASALVTRLKLMSQLDISEKRLPQDGRFSINVKGKTIDVRLSTMPIAYGESVVMRLLDQSAGTMELDQLGIPEDMLPNIKRLIGKPQGMVLVTGPTGSGKTTTLYAALNYVNRPDNKIITVEDPVEYRLPRINQVQVHPRIGLDFARVLRTALRQDPDIILVGEMRDKETVDIGLRAAMTGHMVFSTLHTNSALATINRLMDMGAAGYMLASSLDAVIAQRLVRRVCDSCGRDKAPSARQLAWLRAKVGPEQADQMKFREGRGCPYCGNTGYRGRIGVYELLELDATLIDALRRDDLQEFERQAQKRPDYRPLVMCALDYAEQGTTSLAEVIRLAGGLEGLSVVTDLDLSLSD
jgi:MSHA biogenesis protein MshE